MFVAFSKRSRLETWSNKQLLIKAMVSISGKATPLHLSHWIVCLFHTSLSIKHLAFMQACTLLMK